jgi:hypothetical protein
LNINRTPALPNPIQRPLHPCLQPLLGKRTPDSSKHQHHTDTLYLSQTTILLRMASPPPPAGDTIIFRPSKKRKIYRQRPSTSLDDEEPQPASPNAPLPSAPTQTNAQSIDELIASTSTATSTLPPGSAGEGEELEGTPVSIAEILRLRKKNKRAGGVEFRAEAHIVRDEDGLLVIRPAPGEGELRSLEGESGMSGVPRKFAPQTGTVGDVNKHM